HTLHDVLPISEAVTAVWTGYDDNQPIERGDEKPIAKNVWADTIEAAHKGKEDTDFKVPDGIVKKLIDPESGKLAGDECPVARTTYFEAGTEPTEKCTIHSDTISLLSTSSRHSI